MDLSSAAFAQGGDIPRRYTCEGEDVSAPLSWADVPTAAKSLALIVDDPDAPDPAAPKMTWVHWVLYDLPPSVHRPARGRRVAAAGSARGQERLGTHRLGRPLPADRSPPLLLQALCARRRAARAAGRKKARSRAP